MFTGILVFVALYNFASSLTTGAVSVVVPVFRLSFAITVVLAVWLLDEPLTEWKLAGLAAALAAVWLLLGRAPSAARVTLSSVLRVLVATVMMGIVSFIYKIGMLAGGTPATILTGQAAAYLPLATAFALRRDRGFRPPPGVWRYGITTALTQLLGLVMLISGLRHGEASVLVPIAQLGFLITAGLGFLLLGETFTVRKGLGLAFTIMALACLTRT
jgi:uncharacterized membrane protein